MLNLKSDHPLLCEFPILLSTVRLKLGHKFSQLIHRFNICILKYWSGAVYMSKFFPIHKRDGRLGFLKSLHWISEISAVHKKDFCPLAFIFGQMVRVVFQYDHIWRHRGANLWLNYQFSRKNVNIIANVGNNLCQFKSLKYCFQT